jgi:hypothetical protein
MRSRLGGGKEGDILWEVTDEVEARRGPCVSGSTRLRLTAPAASTSADGNKERASLIATTKGSRLDGGSASWVCNRWWTRSTGKVVIGGALMGENEGKFAYLKIL